MAKTIFLITLFTTLGVVFTYEMIEFHSFKRMLRNYIDIYPRMTAQDGQELCIRLQLVERAQGIQVKPCSYY